MVDAPNLTPTPPADAPIRRGARWLTERELCAHLAALVRLENVSVLLGAGASSGPLSGLTMSALWKRFCEDSKTSFDWLQKNDFVARETSAVPNVEELADTLEIARLEWTRTNATDLPSLQSALDNLKRAVMRASILKQEWWEQPDLAARSPELGPHRDIIQKLCGARQPGQPSPWFFTTNYDLAVEWSAESVGLRVANGFGGVHHRAFAPHDFDLAFRNTLARGEARFGTYNIYLAKLHGSLSWRLLDGTNVVEEAAHHVWPTLKNFLDGKNSADGRFLVLPSATKYTQTVGFVLGELFRRFAEFLARPHSVLVTNGYSFADEHINRVIFAALQNPTLQLVIYLPEASRSGDEIKVPKDKSWLLKLIALRSPQVTVVGGNAKAYLAALAAHLPEPALFDEPAAQIRERLRDVENFASDDGGTT